MKNKISMISCVAAMAGLFMTMTATSARAASLTGAECAAFGAAPAGTFGLTGIPVDQVCMTLGFGTASTGIALSATPRFANNPLTNDGAGVYTAETGGDTLNARPDLHRFNDDFNFYNNTASALVAELYVDTANGIDTDIATFALLTLNLAPNTSAFDSENDAFAFWQNGVLGLVAPSTGGAPNVNANGQFDLLARIIDPSANNRIVQEAAIRIFTTGGPDTGNPVPEPMTLLLTGSGLAFIARKYRRKNGADQLSA